MSDADDDYEPLPWLPPAAMPCPVIIEVTATNGVKFLANVDRIVVWENGMLARLNKDGRGQLCLETVDEIRVLREIAAQRLMQHTARRMGSSGHGLG